MKLRPVDTTLRGVNHIFLTLRYEEWTDSSHFFFSHINIIYLPWSECSLSKIMEHFVVFWLTVTIHEQNLSPDKCAVLGNSINNENALCLQVVRCRRRITEFIHQKRYFCVTWWWNTKYFLHGAHHCFILAFHWDD